MATPTRDLTALPLDEGIVESKGADTLLGGRESDRRNGLNELDVRTWMKFTKSWFTCNPPPRSASQVQHPAKFPEALVRDFVAFFTKSGETVLDPFSGVGSAVVGSASLGRRGVGIELSPVFHQLATQGLPLSPDAEVYVNGDAREAVSVCRQRGIDEVHYVITSPPYWDMLDQSRGGVDSVQKERAGRGLRTSYSAGDGDLSNIGDYPTFLQELTSILADLKRILVPNRYLTIIIQNVRVRSGEVRPLAWDLTRALSEHYTFKGERIWLQDNKRLGCWGWPSEFVTNVHHHYCLVFKNDR
jgi:DNA modification methylase